MEITKEEWEAWKQLPVTQEFLKIKQERAETLAHSLAAGSCLDNPSGYAYACGQYEEIRDTLEAKYEDMVPR